MSLRKVTREIRECDGCHIDLAEVVDAERRYTIEWENDSGDGGSLDFCGDCWARALLKAKQPERR